ncbi:MAG: potassium channel family protein, partial [Geothrix sp.]|nr:potassium channel family protein [Geothrix sp.]
MRAGTPFPRGQDVQQDAPVKRLRYALALLVAVIVAGALGYHWLSHLDALDSLYMAITTLFTVGFRELG